ncbi:hypothetical protein CDL12_23044 [Handroanthus impetiginosus]|uniref:Transmembrane protein n=1 Tax=Handroanthus impetiginosus TaxID=429701 RepID=A0A2G9GGK3_9LAMI|nr:hypothetical protein CDL12_23044 [Handroanthus impetiginosus]
MRNGRKRAEKWHRRREKRGLITEADDCRNDEMIMVIFCKILFWFFFFLVLTYLYQWVLFLCGYHQCGRSPTTTLAISYSSFQPFSPNRIVNVMLAVVVDQGNKKRIKNKLTQGFP